jgi:hypothetical protein
MGILGDQIGDGQIPGSKLDSPTQAKVAGSAPAQSKAEDYAINPADAGAFFWHTAHNVRGTIANDLPDGFEFKVGVVSELYAYLVQPPEEENISTTMISLVAVGGPTGDPGQALQYIGRTATYKKIGATWYVTDTTGGAGSFEGTSVVNNVYWSETADWTGTALEMLNLTAGDLPQDVYAFADTSGGVVPAALQGTGQGTGGEFEAFLTEDSGTVSIEWPEIPPNMIEITPSQGGDETLRLSYPSSPGIEADLLLNVTPAGFQNASGVQFDADGDLLVTSSALGGPVSSPCTVVSFWLFADPTLWSTSAVEPQVMGQWRNSKDWRFTVFDDVGTHKFKLSIGDGLVAVSEWKAPLGIFGVAPDAWHHVLLVFDPAFAASQPLFYIDNQFQPLTPVGLPQGVGSISQGTNLSIAQDADPDGIGNNDSQFLGEMDELAVWLDYPSGVLPGNQIAWSAWLQSWYSVAPIDFNGISDEPSHWWRLADGQYSPGQEISSPSVLAPTIGPLFLDVHGTIGIVNGP